MKKRDKLTIASSIIAMVCFIIIGCIPVDVDGNADVDINPNLDTKIETDVKPEALTALKHQIRDIVQETVAETIEKQNITNNTGFMSGGAPWVLAAFAIFLYITKARDAQKAKIKVLDKEREIGTLKKQITTLSSKPLDKKMRIQNHFKEAKRNLS